MRLSDNDRESMLRFVNWQQDVDYWREDSNSYRINCLALDLADELAAAQRREKRLKRQVELMGWLIQSHESDQHELMGRLAARRGMAVTGYPTFCGMGDPSDEGEYTDDDLELICEWCKPAADELLRRQMAADNPDHRDDAARQAWEESR